MTIKSLEQVLSETRVCVGVGHTHEIEGAAGSNNPIPINYPPPKSARKQGSNR